MEHSRVEQAREHYIHLKKNIIEVIKGKDAMIDLLLASFFCGGHVLLEDLPGTGKTTLAKALAFSLGTVFKRIQFTPDLLPSDIIGVNIYNRHQESFTFHQGPVFSNVLLADEINRASPRTQSALLEAMGEKQVSVEGRSHAMERLFFVIATENPVESHGTYPLPESQMDRFTVKLIPGYLSRDEEATVIGDQLMEHPLSSVRQILGVEDVFAVMDAVKRVRISEELRYYIVDLVARTRTDANLLNGASVRASLALMKVSQALALFASRDFVIPDDIARAAVPVIAHRVQLMPQARFSGLSAVQIVADIVAEIKAPS